METPIEFINKHRNYFAFNSKPPTEIHIIAVGNFIGIPIVSRKSIHVHVQRIQFSIETQTSCDDLNKMKNLHCRGKSLCLHNDWNGF